MDEANGESGSPAAGPAETGDGLPSRRVPGQRDPVARPEPGISDVPAQGIGPEAVRGADPVIDLPAGPGADGDLYPAGHPAPDGTGTSGLNALAADRSELSDAELVDQVRGGQDSAYEELYRRHAEAVRRYARGCCRDAHTAEDLTGEVFARTLQAIRGGSGPQSAVRAYLLTTVRRVAANWGSTARREQLVEDFAVFAISAAGSTATQETAELGADVRAMHEAERSLAIRAFRTLPERWQTVLWHTAVEDESPSEIAPLLGLTPNATAVLAHRAREGLRQAYLQAHVSTTLTAEGACARYADRLGAHARGALRTRADRELNRHLKECARCSAASMELADLNSALKGLLPVAYIGWFAAAYAAKAAGFAVAGGVAAAGAAGGAAMAASGGGGAAGSAVAGGGGAVASEGLGAPAKLGIGAGVVAAVAAAALAFALTGGDGKEPPKPVAKPTVAVPVASVPPAPSPPPPSPAPKPVVPPAPRPSPSPTPTPTPPPPKPSPRPTPKPAPPAKPSPSPRPTPPPTTPAHTTPPPAPVVYKVNSLPVGYEGDGATSPTIRPSASSWWWDRWGLGIDGTRYDHGITVHAPSTVTIDLNRACTSYDAAAGIDDLTAWLRAPVTFTVSGDGTPLWTSPTLRGGDPAVPVHVRITGYQTLQLTVTPQSAHPTLPALADWADSAITCA